MWAGCTGISGCRGVAAYYGLQSAESIRTVSYTHLDVYKRQAYKLTTNASVQDLAFVFGEGVADEKYVSLKTIRIAQPFICLLIYRYTYRFSFTIE